MNLPAKEHLGFIGQGYVGKSYADWFAARGHDIVRYSLEPEHFLNEQRIVGCDIVFIAVPTPTTPEGFDDSSVRDALALVGAGKTAIVKSTLVPGTTEALQEAFPDRLILFSPEFLSEATAAKDTAEPFMSIIGVPTRDATHETAAAHARVLLPQAPFSLICDSTEAELIKYAHNVNGYMQIVLWNLFYDLATAHGVSWGPICAALTIDPFISHRYLSPIDKNGRGAGGHCFMKDFAAFRMAYDSVTGDTSGTALLYSFERKNSELLRKSGKNVELLDSIYEKKFT